MVCLSLLHELKSFLTVFMTFLTVFSLQLKNICLVCCGWTYFMSIAAVLLLWNLFSFVCLFELPFFILVSSTVYDVTWMLDLHFYQNIYCLHRTGSVSSKCGAACWGTDRLSCVWWVWPNVWETQFAIICRKSVNDQCVSTCKQWYVELVSLLPEMKGNEWFRYLLYWWLVFCSCWLVDVQYVVKQIQTPRIQITALPFYGMQVFPETWCAPYFCLVMVLSVISEVHGIMVRILDSWAGA